MDDSEPEENEVAFVVLTAISLLLSVILIIIGSGLLLSTDITLLQFENVFIPYVIAICLGVIGLFSYRLIFMPFGKEAYPLRSCDEIYVLTFLPFSVICNVLAVVGLIITIIFQNKIMNTYKTKIFASINKYREVISDKVLIDHLQRTFQCCGALNYEDYFSIDWAGTDVVPDGETSYYVNKRHHVPFSCCKRKTLVPCVWYDLEDETNMEGINHQGCVKALIQHRNMVVLLLCMLFGFIAIAQAFLEWNVWKMRKNKHRVSDIPNIVTRNPQRKVSFDDSAALFAYSEKESLSECTVATFTSAERDQQTVDELQSEGTAWDSDAICDGCHSSSCNVPMCSNLRTVETKWDIKLATRMPNIDNTQDACNCCPMPTSTHDRSRQSNDIRRRVPSTQTGDPSKSIYRSNDCPRGSDLQRSVSFNYRARANDMHRVEPTRNDTFDTDYRKMYSQFDQPNHQRRNVKEFPSDESLWGSECNRCDSSSCKVTTCKFRTADPEHSSKLATYVSNTPSKKDTTDFDEYQCESCTLTFCPYNLKNEEHVHHTDTDNLLKQNFKPVSTAGPSSDIMHNVEDVKLSYGQSSHTNDLEKTEKSEIDTSETDDICDECPSTPCKIKTCSKVKSYNFSIVAQKSPSPDTDVHPTVPTVDPEITSHNIVSISIDGNQSVDSKNKQNSEGSLQSTKEYSSGETPKKAGIKYSESDSDSCNNTTCDLKTSSQNNNAKKYNSINIASNSIN